MAIARLVLRTKQYLAAIRPLPATRSVLETLLYHDEVTLPDDVEGLPPATTSRSRTASLKIARQLIESLSTEFEPEQYRDDYREKVLELIEQKAAGTQIVTQPAPPGAHQGGRPHGRARSQPRRRQGPRGRASKSNGEVRRRRRRQAEVEGQEERSSRAKAGAKK